MKSSYSPFDTISNSNTLSPTCPLSKPPFRAKSNFLPELSLFVPTASGPAADLLQQALLPVVGQETCSLPDWWSVLATDKMVCAGGDGITAGCRGTLVGP